MQKMILDIAAIIRVKHRIVGHVCGDTFYKKVKASRHFLRVPPAIAFDVQSLQDAQNAGAVFVEVTDKETDKRYRQSIDTILHRGFRVSRRYGEQVALPLGEWMTDQEPAAAQLAFSFGV